MAEAPIDFSLLAGANAPVHAFKAGETIFREALNVMRTLARRLRARNAAL